MPLVNYAMNDHGYKLPLLCQLPNSNLSMPLPTFERDVTSEPIVGLRSNFKKIPTHTQDHGDA